MKIRAGVGGGVLSCMLVGGTTVVHAAPAAAAPTASAAQPAATISLADAERVSAESVRQLVAHHRRGYDLSYVARTTLARDLPAWRVAAGKNKPAGQLMLGLCNYHGVGGAHNAERGRELISAAAKGGHAEATAVLSIILRNGNLDTRPDVDEANGWLGKALAARSEIARDEVTLSAAKELLVAGKVDEAIDAYASSMKAGSLSARVALAGILRRAWLRDSNVADALVLLEQAANDAHVGAMTELGNIYAYGRYVPRDPMKAKRWLDAAAQTGDPRGLAAAARGYELGLFSSTFLPDLPKASALSTRLEANGDPFSAFVVCERDSLRRTARTPEFDAKEKSLLLGAAARGNPQAYAIVGHCYYNGGLGFVKDLAQCERYFEDGVAAGDPLAYFQRACAARFGYYAPANEAKAREDYFAAARLGVPRAITSLGLRYMTGRGVPQDPKLGHLCYLSAAFEGDPEAMAAVAGQFESGYGAERDPARARTWCQIAITEGDVEAFATLALLEGSDDPATMNGLMPPKALAMLEEGSRRGSLICERQLGHRLVHGKGVKQDVKRGMSVLEHAAIRDEFGVSHSMLGHLCLEGKLIPRDLPGALLYFRTAAGRGHGDSWAQLAYMSELGLGTARNPAEAIRCIEKGITLGSSVSMYEMGRHAAAGDLVPKDVNRAITLWRQAAEQQYAPAQRVVGDYCLRGTDGVPLDELQGIAWMTRALEQGDTFAALLAARFYRDRGDFIKERTWLDKGDTLGDATCANDIGVQYRFGRGVPQDFAKAAEAYKRAADRGSPDATTNLAWCYETGNGVTKDLAEAFRLQLKAASLGHAEAMLHVGRMHLDGVGTARDQKAGFDWLVKSADAGEARAKLLVDAARAKGLIRRE